MRRIPYAPSLASAALLSLALGSGCSDDSKSPSKDAAVDFKLTDGIAKEKKTSADTRHGDAKSTKVTITKIIPDNGFADGGKSGKGTSVVITGTGFVQGNTTVYGDGGNAFILQGSVNGSSLTVTIPKNPYDTTKPTIIQISLSANGITSSNQVNFQYTVSQAMDSTYEGSITTASTTSYALFKSGLIYGQVYLSGTTDTTTGDSGKITAQVGVGTTGTNPSKDSGWSWSTASFSADSTTDSNYDIYAGKVKASSTGTFDVAYRFSKDGGKTFIYADTDETDLAYDTSKAGSLTASTAPDGYCVEDADCSGNLYEVYCDTSANECYECTSDTDCANNPTAGGPTCSSKACLCSSEADCAKNANGTHCSGVASYDGGSASGSGRCYICTSDDHCKSSSSGHICTAGSSKIPYCGCAADTDCPKGKKCQSSSQTPVCY
jgi:hypothetical protein